MFSTKLLTLLVLSNIAATLATGGTSYASFHSPHQGKYHYGVLHHYYGHGPFGYGGLDHGYGGLSYGHGDGGHLGGYYGAGHGATSYANLNQKSYGSYPVLVHSGHHGFDGLDGDHDFSYGGGYGHGYDY
ncbi:uncharacterized protein [Rhodnius prolixus]|uniref:uncharacterized protein n=1 Tax=Rhodnius prolixus TaxID=13249 RepID=UPI003D1894D7